MSETCCSLIFTSCDLATLWYSAKFRVWRRFWCAGFESYVRRHPLLTPILVLSELIKMSEIIETVGSTKNMKPLPQVVMKDESKNYKINAACYETGTSVQIIDVRKNVCVPMGIDTFDSSVKLSGELVAKAKAMQVSILCVLFCCLCIHLLQLWLHSPKLCMYYPRVTKTQAY